VQINLQHLAVHDPVPPRPRLALEGEVLPDERPHVIVHEPRREQHGLGQRTPYSCARKWQEDGVLALRAFIYKHRLMYCLAEPGGPPLFLSRGPMKVPWESWRAPGSSSAPP
jgi:hypothetical protein